MIMKCKYTAIYITGQFRLFSALLIYYYSIITSILHVSQQQIDSGNGEYLF